MTKDDARPALIDADKGVVTIGDTLQVYIGSDAVNTSMPADIRKGLNRGDVVKFSDGTKQFIDSDVIIDTSKTGSDAFIWNAAGDKVKHNRVLVTIDKDGNRSTKVLGSVFKKP